MIFSLPFKFYFRLMFYSDSDSPLTFSALLDASSFADEQFPFCLCEVAMYFVVLPPGDHILCSRGTAELN